MCDFPLEELEERVARAEHFADEVITHLQELDRRMALVENQVAQLNAYVIRLEKGAAAILDYAQGKR